MILLVFTMTDMCAQKQTPKITPIINWFSNSLRSTHPKKGPIVKLQLVLGDLV